MKYIYLLRILLNHNHKKHLISMKAKTKELQIDIKEMTKIFCGVHQKAQI